MLVTASVIELDPTSLASASGVWSLGPLQLNVFERMMLPDWGLPFAVQKDNTTHQYFTATASKL
jgi:hypothetical protein